MARMSFAQQVDTGHLNFLIEPSFESRQSARGIFRSNMFGATDVLAGEIAKAARGTEAAAAF
jgi:hypothetical protein